MAWAPQATPGAAAAMPAQQGAKARAPTYGSTPGQMAGAVMARPGGAMAPPQGMPAGGMPPQGFAPQGGAGMPTAPQGMKAQLAARQAAGGGMPPQGMAGTPQGAGMAQAQALRGIQTPTAGQFAR